MAKDWDPAVYRSRARQWFQQAEQTPPGKEREAYMHLAEGYMDLADLTERDGAAGRQPSKSMEH